MQVETKVPKKVNMYRRIVFTFNELIVIEAATTIMSADLLQIKPWSKALKLKIGRAICEANEKQSAELELTDNECWLIRDYINIREKQGPELVGLSIKLKIYGALGDFEIKEELGLSVLDEI